jgi:TRAP-type C4-dicarboxylate transport system substrate-binding protein
MNLFRTLPTLAAFVGILGVSTSVNAQTVLSVSSWVPPTHLITNNMRTWCADIEKGTQSRVKCNVLAKPVAPPPGALNSVRSGLADVSFTVAAYNTEPLPVAMLTALPFLSAGTKANAEFFAIANQRNYERHLAKADEFKGVKVLAISNGSALQMYFSTSKPINTLADLKGLKMMVGDKYAADLVTALGMEPVVKPATQMYELFSGGIVDGALNPLEAIKSFKVGSYIKSALLVPGGFRYAMHLYYISDATWNKISKEDQAVLMAAAGEKMSRRHGQGFDQEDRAGLDDIKANGAKITVATPAMIKDLSNVGMPIAKQMSDLGKAKGIDVDRFVADMRSEIENVAKGQ